VECILDPDWKISSYFGIGVRRSVTSLRKGAGEMTRVVDMKGIKA
jgi:hypothetical protein